MIYGFWNLEETELSEGDRKLWLQCHGHLLLPATFCCHLGHIYRNTVSWASFQTHRMRTSKSGPGFLSNILFLVVLLPGQAWEPLLKAIFHMRQIRPEKCLPWDHTVNGRGLPGTQLSLPGSSGFFPLLPQAPGSTVDWGEGMTVCVCTFSSVLQR